MRRGRESNPRMSVLQTEALPLRHHAKQKELYQKRVFDSITQYFILILILFMLIILIQTIVIPILILGLTTLLFLFLIGNFTFDAPFIPIPGAVLLRIKQALNLHSNSILYDLGSGDARVLITCGDGPYEKLIGIEKGPIPYFISKLRLLFHTQKQITILRKNFFDVDLGNATHIFTYLLPKVLEQLEPKFQKELRPGTRLVTCDFKLKHKIPNETIQLDRPKHALGKTLYVYIF